MKRLLTAGESARFLGLTYKQFRGWQEKIPSVRRGNGWRYFLVKDLERFDQFINPPKPQPQTKQPRGRTMPLPGQKDFWE